MKSDFLIAVTQLAAERNLPREMVISAVETALASTYKKGTVGGEVKVVLDQDSNDFSYSVYALKTIVDEIEDEDAHLTLEQARTLRPGQALAVGDVLEFPIPAQDGGRIEAQTTKQVVIQRLREAERELIYSEFSEREGEVFTATVQRSEARYGGPVRLDLNGRTEAVLPREEQSPYDRYRPGVRLKVMITSVERTPRGPEILVSRARPELLRRLFEMEVPEIFNGIVEIRGIAREAGSRSKVAVSAAQDGVDPVGACVGLRGIRIQNIVSELQGEKIDVIQWSRDPSVFLSNALSPAQPLRVVLDPSTSTATVVVQDRQLSLAIGRDGQNARLAAKLTGWNIDIKSSTDIEIERLKQDLEGQAAEAEVPEGAVAVAAAEAKAAPSEPQVVEGEELAPAAVAEEVDGAVAAEAPAAIAEAAEAEEGVAIVEEGEAATEAESDQEAVAAAPGAGMSAEELLALESLELEAEPAAAAQEVVEVIEEVEGEDEASVEVEVAEEDEQDIWKVPEVDAGPVGIRFAEDILGEQSRGGGGRGGRRGGGGNRRPPKRPARR